MPTAAPSVVPTENEAAADINVFSMSSASETGFVRALQLSRDSDDEDDYVDEEYGSDDDGSTLYIPESHFTSMILATESQYSRFSNYVEYDQVYPANSVAFSHYM